MLSARGRRVLAGKESAVCGSVGRDRFMTAGGLFDAETARAVPALLDRCYGAQLAEMVQPLPAANAGTSPHEELLPKTGRVMTSPFDGTGEAPASPDDSGLRTMLRSGAYLEFVEALCGYAVKGPESMQVLCYRPGDYSGPHTDHIPQHADSRGGYTDIHFTFCSSGAKRQLLVYERASHFSQVVPISASGTVTGYRLPMWHYTTPFEGTAASRRWLILGSFLDASA